VTVTRGARILALVMTSQRAITPRVAAAAACTWAAGALACGVSRTPPPASPTPAVGAPAWPAADESFIEQSASTFGFRLGRPAAVEVAPDGTILFTRTPAREFAGDLFALDPATGKVRTLLTAAALLDGAEEQLSAEEKARRERMRHATRGIGSYALSEDGKTLLVPLSNRLYAVERATGKVRQLATGDGFPYDPQLSPTGDRVAFVVDGDLWVTALAGGAPRRLTTRPGPAIEHGIAEFVAQEEMGRRRGHWWSPDGRRLVYQRSDVSAVDTLWVSDPAQPDRAPTAFRYPRAGTRDAEVTLGVIAVAGGPTTWLEWDRARYPYLTRVGWNRGGPLTLVVMNETQTELAVLGADPDTGATKVLLTETDPAWLNLPPGDLPRWLRDGSGFVWASEREGAWQLELRRADGRLERALTPLELGMEGYGGLDDEAGLALVSAAPDPTQRHVYLVPVAGGEPRQLTREDGVHMGYLPEHGKGIVLSSLPRAGGMRAAVVGLDGGVIAELPSVAEEPPWTPRVEWTTAALDGREHHAAIIRPRAFDPARRYPVLVHVYAGPHTQMVNATPLAYLHDQWYADAGFIVVAIDGRGTPGRGRDWERAIHRDLITIPLADQAGVLQALGARYRELDLERVGIYGWSFGGYASAMAVLLHPQLFKAAVAGAPVTDWRLYDTFYTERYMQTPDTNPEGYERTSALSYAAELSRPLLIVHGTGDDNVHVAHSLQLVAAAFRAGRSVEFLPVAATHMTPDPAVAKALHGRQLAFFRAHL
jgi:dipeptidyl-peptidase-4